MSASNLRAANYSIPPADRHKVRCTTKYFCGELGERGSEREGRREGVRKKEGAREGRERGWGGGGCQSPSHQLVRQINLS